MHKSEEQIRKKCQRFERIRDKKVEKLNTDRIPEENLPKVHRKVGRHSQVIGLFNLALEECEVAIREFRTSAEWYISALEEFRSRRDTAWESEANNVLDLLYSVLLTGDEELLDQASEIALTVPEEYLEKFPTAYRYYYMKALAASILDTGAQVAYLNKLEETLDDLDGSHAAFFGALWRALAGIEARDADQFTAGIDQLLDWHDGKVDFETKTDPKDLVCRQAAALLVVARRNGMDIHVDSEYVPECVYELS